jgi:hypothetical protein
LFAGTVHAGGDLFNADEGMDAERTDHWLRDQRSSPVCIANFEVLIVLASLSGACVPHLVA